LLQTVILNWAGSEIKIEVYKPDGTFYGELQDTIAPVTIEIPNPDEGQWTFNVTALDIPHPAIPKIWHN
jgi:hypothetical protein